MSDQADPVPGAVQQDSGQLGELRPGAELAPDGQQGPPPAGAERGEPFDQHSGGGRGLQRATLRLAGNSRNDDRDNGVSVKFLWRNERKFAVKTVEIRVISVISRF